ncbi:aminoglycoside phosphotransferase family protein [Paenibacillus alkalitolerans]|uniref:aminoglycoside phosphotransferase family protein n=1 Tax=Paenibacillus alkalitolerans TaxID=2799335 RepID=UPI0018F4D481|nr:aminoglycoside phosphotransferase family protein [Paenibacillus alkalitolerans]
MIKKDAPHIDLVKQLVSDCLNSKAFMLERVLSGVSTYVYRVHFDGNIFYLRILPEHNLSFGVEVHVHSLLREKEVQVPEVIYFEHHNEAIGMSVMLVKEIHGSSVEACSSMNEYEGILFEAGKQIAILNKVKVDGFGPIKRGKEEYGIALRGEKNSLHDYIYEYLDEDLFLLSENVFNKNVTSRIKSTLNTGTAQMLSHQSYLSHGDFDDSHIFFHNGKFTGIIDFGEIEGNSPLYDLGHYKMHDGRRYAGYHSLVKGYNEVKALTYDDQIEIDLWALWIGVRRLGIVLNRTWGSYHEHLIKMVNIQLDILSKKL